jgi:hypothetical protein
MGRALRRRQYNGPLNGFEDALALAVSPDGARVFVIGFGAGSHNTHVDFTTIAYRG